MPGWGNLLGFAFDVELKPLPKGPQSRLEAGATK
jgi:hypothetical protein